jgi:hypothetical protein
LLKIVDVGKIQNAIIDTNLPKDIVEALHDLTVTLVSDFRRFKRNLICAGAGQKAHGRRQSAGSLLPLVESPIVRKRQWKSGPLGKHPVERNESEHEEPCDDEAGDIDAVTPESEGGAQLQKVANER